MGVGNEKKRKRDEQYVHLLVAGVRLERATSRL